MTIARIEPFSHAFFPTQHSLGFLDFGTLESSRERSVKEPPFNENVICESAVWFPS